MSKPSTDIKARRASSGARSHSWLHSETFRRPGRARVYASGRISETFPKKWRTLWVCKRCGAKVGFEKRQLTEPTPGQLRVRDVISCKLQLARSILKL